MTGQQRIGNGVLRTVVLIMATMTTGLFAGVFVNWSNAVMPGLSNVDDRTFVAAFQALDAAITNPLFLGVGLMGSLLFTGLSVALHLRAGQRPVLMWVGAALVCVLVVLTITFGVHEPLNERIRTAAEPGSNAELAAVRAQLDETMWTAWNTVRAVAATIGFGCLTWALVIHRGLGQAASRPTERPVTGSGEPRWDTRHR
ncbi:anthrone oxygenase family protein [Streptomyces sp. SYSU K21746]